MAWYKRAARFVSDKVGDVAEEVTETALEYAGVNPQTVEMAGDIADAQATAASMDVAEEASEAVESAAETASNVAEVAGKTARNVFTSGSSRKRPSKFLSPSRLVAKATQEVQDELDQLTEGVSDATEGAREYLGDRLSKESLEEDAAFAARSAEFALSEAAGLASNIGATVNDVTDALIQGVVATGSSGVALAAELSNHVVAGNPYDDASLSLLGVKKAGLGTMANLTGALANGLRALDPSRDPLGDPESLANRIDSLERLSAWANAAEANTQDQQILWIEASDEIKQAALDLGYSSVDAMLVDLTEAGSGLKDVYEGQRNIAGTPALTAYGLLGGEGAQQTVSQIQRERDQDTPEATVSGLTTTALLGAGPVAGKLVGAGGIAAARLLNYARKGSKLGPAVTEYLDRL